MISCYQTVLLYVCLCSLGLIAIGSFIAFAVRHVVPVFACLRRSGRINALLALVVIALLTVYGGSKPAANYTVRMLWARRGSRFCVSVMKSMVSQPAWSVKRVPSAIR